MEGPRPRPCSLLSHKKWLTTLTPGVDGVPSQEGHGVSGKEPRAHQLQGQREMRSRGEGRAGMEVTCSNTLLRPLHRISPLFQTRKVDAVRSVHPSPVLTPTQDQPGDSRHHVVCPHGEEALVRVSAVQASVCVRQKTPGFLNVSFF